MEYPGKSAAFERSTLPLAGEVVAVFDADAWHQISLRSSSGFGSGDGLVQFKREEKFSSTWCPRRMSSFPVCNELSRWGVTSSVVPNRAWQQSVDQTRGFPGPIGGWNNKAITDDLDTGMRLLISSGTFRFTLHAYVCVGRRVPQSKGLLRQRKRWAEEFDAISITFFFFTQLADQIVLR
jgi:cellulose synthase/poly-beta-1,6-N-acetylglucosamine synthase-like glycosyltransferase